MSIKRYKELYNSADEGTSQWFDLDVRYEKISVRPIMISMTEGDTVTLEGIVKDVKGIDKSFLDTLEDSDITLLKEYTESGEDLIEGNWTYIRVTKAGTTGTVKVSGFI